MYRVEMICSLLLLVTFADYVSAGYECYSCTSESFNCKETFFTFGVGVKTEQDCTCCLKTVSESLTTRECLSGIRGAECIGSVVSSRHVCSGDRCNVATRASVQSGVVMATAALIAVTLLLAPRN